MTGREVVQVFDRDGYRGQTEMPPVEEPNGRVLVRLEDGRGMLLDPGLLERQADGSYQTPLRFDALLGGSMNRVDSDAEVVIPVIEEALSVEKREVERGRFRIAKTVSERDVLVDQPLRREHVEVERVPVNQMVETPPDIRYEGDTMIVPVLEEVVVAEIRLMVREEIRITRRQEAVHDSQNVTLRREDVQIDPLSEDVDVMGDAQTPPD